MITHVRAKNFLSWSDLSFNVNSGVTLIDGWNEDDQTSEGSGKSAILNAISWCLYGKLPKDAKIDDVIKRGESSCVVAVSISGNTVIRSRKPNELCIVDSNETIIKGKDAKETQDLIETFVGLSFETFCQTVYFAQNYPKKFITANQEEKGKILSEVQDLTVFDRARKEVVELLKTEELNLTKIKHHIETLGLTIEVRKADARVEERKIQSAFEVHAEVEKSIINSIESLQEECLKLNTQIEELSARTIEFSEVVFSALTEQSQSLYSTQVNLKSELTTLDKVLKSRASSEARGKMLAQKCQDLMRQKEVNEAFIKNPTSVCPTCNSTLENCDTSKAHAEVQNIESLMASYVEELNALSVELDTPAPDRDGLKAKLEEAVNERLKIDVELAKVRGARDEQVSIKAKVETLNVQLLNKLRALEETEAKLDEWRNTSPNVDTQTLIDLQEQILSLTTERSQFISMVDEKQSYVGRLEKLKEGFKEVKSHIFNSMLNEINSKVHQYLSHLFEVPVSVRFRNDSMKIETDVEFDGAERGLGLLSGGQFRRVSLAVDLALSDVITARKGSNLGILILDEYFKDLSESSMEKCLSLLEGRGQPVLLIEHNSIFKNIVTNAFHVRLRDGASSVEA